ncbi:MAG: bifunctional nuclease family protein [Thermodesulfobacteriota bacterium]
MFLKMTVSGLTIDPFTNAPVVILKDTDDKNSLPIWIGLLEASAIAAELEKIQFSRPMTHDLLKDVLGRMDVTVEKIEVNDIKDNVYYATIHINVNNTSHEIDARPSDAIALALRTRSPIYVSTEVIDKSNKMELDDADGKKRIDSKKWSELLDELSPESFGKYKM